jgi:hypothetical protein
VRLGEKAGERGLQSALRTLAPNDRNPAPAAAAVAGGVVAGTQSEDAEAGFTESALRLLRTQADEVLERSGRTMEGERALVRGSRERAKATPALTQAEKDAIRAGVEEQGGSLKAAMEEARRIKANHPSRGVDAPWSPITITGMEVTTDRRGRRVYKPKLQSQPYQFHIDPKTGKEASPDSEHFQRMVSGLADEVIETYRKAQAGDPAAQRIMENEGWYRNVESRGFNEYGSFYDMFGDLLGATSPNTPVATNFKFSRDILQRAARGDFDESIDNFADVMDRVDAAEATMASIENAARNDPNITLKAAKASPEYKAAQAEVKAAKSEIEPIRQENEKLYGINSVNAMTALADRWRIFRKGSAPKAKNFSGNLVGYSIRPTIDVWSARNLRRHAGLPQIPSSAEQGVTGQIIDPEKMESNLEFGFGQRVVESATERVNRELGLNLEPRDMQALQWFIEKDEWSSRGWTNAAGEGGSFETMMDNDPTESLVVGTSRAQDQQYQGRDFIPGPQDQLEVARRVVAEASADPDVVAGKAPTTLGLYGDEAETAFDIDIVSRRDQVPGDTLDLIAQQAVNDAQDSFFVARRIEPRVGDRFPEKFQVGLEAYFENPMPAGSGRLKEIQSFLSERGIQGFTLIVDPRKKPGAMADEIIGVRFIDIPQFYDPDGFAKMSEEAYTQHVTQTMDKYRGIGGELRETFGEVRAAEPSYFDVNVKRRRDAEGYVAQRAGAPEESKEALQQEFWGFKPATERFREYADENPATGMAAGKVAAGTGFSVAAAASQAENLDPEVSSEIDRRVTQRVRGGQYRRRNAQRTERYANIRKALLENFFDSSLVQGSGLLMQALDSPAIDIGQRGFLGAARTGLELMRGGGLDASLQAGANVVNQPVEQTAYDAGAYVQDQGFGPAAATAANIGVQLADPSGIPGL